jgi:hypothetical protein
MPSLLERRSHELRRTSAVAAAGAALTQITEDIGGRQRRRSPLPERRSRGIAAESTHGLRRTSEATVAGAALTRTAEDVAARAELTWTTSAAGTAEAELTLIVNLGGTRSPRRVRSLINLNTSASHAAYGWSLRKRGGRQGVQTMYSVIQF